jgi:hypothetical protein
MAGVFNDGFIVHVSLYFRATLSVVLYIIPKKGEVRAKNPAKIINVIHDRHGIILPPALNSSVKQFSIC